MLEASPRFKITQVSKSDTRLELKYMPLLSVKMEKEGS